MAEEVKKSRPAPDPNSAKFKLGQIAAKAYSDAMEAKKRGEMVGWCASNFPVEIPETLGLYVCYPENQAAGIAARGGGERLLLISVLLKPANFVLSAESRLRLQEVLRLETFSSSVLSIRNR